MKCVDGTEHHACYNKGRVRSNAWTQIPVKEMDLICPIKKTKRRPSEMSHRRVEVETNSTWQTPHVTQLADEHS